MADLSEEYLSPFGELISRMLGDLQSLREAASTEVSKLPANDPIRRTLRDIDRILERTEDNIDRAVRRTGRGGSPLQNLQARQAELIDEIERARAIVVEPVRRRLSEPQKRLPRGK